MTTSARILVPYLSANVYSKAPVAFDELVQAVEVALGVQFAPDKEGQYEELNALVSQPLGYTLAVYSGDVLEVEDNPMGDIRIVVDLTSRISYYALSLPADSVDDPTLWISAYLASLLTTKTGYSFEDDPLPAQANLPGLQIPLLVASIQATTTQPPGVHLAPICKSLGIPMKRLHAATISQPQVQQFTAQVLGHDLVFVLSETRPGNGGSVRLQLKPGAETLTLARDTRVYTPVHLPIDAFIARLVSKATGLAFAALS